MPAVLGVDVSLGRGCDAVLLEDSTVRATWSHVGAAGLGALLAELRPEAVAIDAPPRPGLGLLGDERERALLPVPPAAGRHLTRRVAEYELSRRGIGSHHTPADESRLFSWMTAGFEAFRSAEEAGYTPFFEGPGAAPGGSALEVFPYASYVALAGCLSPGRRYRLEWRRSVLEAAGVRAIPPAASIDVLDAACAALTAERFLAGDGTVVGDPREGVIVLPVSALLDRYHRCPAADVRTRRPCECGCGQPAKNRFLPGHAARHRARLVREIRAGDRARDELRRLGWRPER